MEHSFSLSSAQLASRRGDYGFDAPYVPTWLFLVALFCLAIGLLCLLIWHLVFLLVFFAICAALLLLAGGGYIYTTRRGKFQVWAELLSGLNLRGDEQVLDLGCGRGAVLLMTAALLPQGKVTGIDIWSTHDQSGNDRSVTLKNAQLEGVADRIELQTGDMRQLPFADNTFDLIVSSLAIHNIVDSSGRDKALDEALRVLKPGGKLVITDIFKAYLYTTHLRELGAVDVTYRPLDWRFWYGAPNWKAQLITALKPS